MREIGSEFWDVPILDSSNSFFPEKTQWYLSGRSALKAIIKELSGCLTVAIPSWCCDSIIKPFVDAGIKPLFYPVYWDNRLIIDLNNISSDVLLVMDFFGYTGDIPDLSWYRGVIIRDVTHSVFSHVYNDADYFFGSLRKWCGIWTGGFAWSKNGEILETGAIEERGYIDLRKKAMALKKEYIQNEDEGSLRNTDKGYLGLYDEAERMLENEDIVKACDRDIEMANKLDIYYIVNRRRSNASVLRKAFKDWLIFPSMNESDCPLFVPVLVPNSKRDQLRRFLIDRQIYCPVHWPVSNYHIIEKDDQRIYENELSLICDQRYDGNDMLRIIDTINEFKEK